MLTLKAPVPTEYQLKTRAASGVAGCVKARKALQALRHAELAKAVGR